MSVIVQELVGVDAPPAERATGNRPSAPRLVRSILPSAAEIATARRRLYAKAAVIVALDIASYAALVARHTPIVGRVAAALVLVHGLIATATGIMHDANHGSFSSSRRVNRVVSYTADVLGASSLLWRFQHNELHHRHTNVEGVDADIDQAPFARLVASQPWKPWHRAQHHYLWVLYGFLTLQWFLVSDVVVLVNGAINGQPMRTRPTRADLGRVIAGKLVHATWALAVPMLFHPALTVIAWYVACSWLVGFGLAVIFQLAHCVDSAEFAQVDGGWRGDDIVRHQLRTTVDVHVNNRAARAYVTFLAGGLEYQVEHHLAPRLPHTCYQAMRAKVSAMCAANGLQHRIHPSIPAALAAHQRHLRAMGTKPAR